VTLSPKNAAEMVRPAAGLHRYHPWPQLSRKLDHSLAAHASPQHDSSAMIQPGDAAAVFTQINPEYRDFHCLFPPNRLSEDIMSPVLRRGALFHKSLRAAEQQRADVARARGGAIGRK